MAAEHTRGDMDIKMQKRTFEGVMNAGVSFSLITAVTIFYLTLLFATGTGWFASLILAFAVAIAGGAALKRQAGYWVLIAAAGIVAFIASALVSAFAA